MGSSSRRPPRALGRSAPAVRRPPNCPRRQGPRRGHAERARRAGRRRPPPLVEPVDARGRVRTPLDVRSKGDASHAPGRGRHGPASRASGKRRKALTKGAGKAVGHVTKEAGRPCPRRRRLPRIRIWVLCPASRLRQSAPSAPGLPEDLVIEVPELVPGVPSIGIVPLSLPALPVTPTLRPPVPRPSRHCEDRTARRSTPGRAPSQPGPDWRTWRPRCPLDRQSVTAARSGRHGRAQRALGA